MLVPLLFAQALSAPHTTAVQADKPPVIDGRLDDEVWSKAPIQRNFTQKFPNEKEALVGETSFRVLYDDAAIYIAIECEQTKVPIVARLARRDSEIESDWVSVAIDARGDGRTAVELKVNAAGALSDAIRFDDTEIDTDWDETWEAQVDETSRGWTAELRIPLRILRFGGKPPANGWGLQVRRYTSLAGETDEWAYIPRGLAGEVSRYGRLAGVNAKPPAVGGFELRPFVVGRLDRRDPGTETLRSGVELGGSLGLDAKWHARSDLTLDLALLPDFAQVEADRLILNLTNEEIVLPEKRPLFFEGRDVFATPYSLFYTRRVGRIAPAAPELPSGEMAVDAPRPARLLGATKLTGRLAEGLRVGAFSALTDANEIEVQRPNGDRYRRVIEPRKLVQVLRLRQELPGNATAGFFASSVTRGEDTHGTLCPNGLSVRPGERCFHDAYVGAFDARWRSENGDWSAISQVVGSVLRDGPARTLRDGTVIRGGDAGFGGGVGIMKDGGVPWRGEVFYDGRSRRLDYNDAGFMPRQNVHQVSSFFGRQTVTNWWVTRETRTGFEVGGGMNNSGIVLDHNYAFGSEWKLQNFWQLEAYTKVIGRRFDDREVGDGTALERRELVQGHIGVDSDPRRFLSGEIDVDVQKIFDGFMLRTAGVISVRTQRRLEVSFEPEFVHASGEPRLAGASSDRLLFGKLEASQLSGTLRASLTFTPRFSLQTYAQLFFASGHYADFGEYRGARGQGAIVRRDSLLAAAAPSVNPDFIDAAVNMNVVFRWEYLLGSTLFLVYTRTQAPRLQLSPSQRGYLDFGSLDRAPAIDTILLKLSYFFG